MSQAPDRHPIRIAIATALAFVSGALVAVQSRINGELSQQLGDPFATAFFSFASGLVVVAVVVAVAPTGRRGVRVVIDAIRSGRMPWWYTLGGVAGAVFVLSASILVALIGVALFTVGVVAGQTISSLLIDRRGLGSMAAKPLTLPRLLGAALALVAVVVAVSGQLHADVPFWVLLAPFAAGIVVGWQQAVNGQVREVSSSPLTATFVSFVSGTLVLAIALIVHLLLVPLPSTFPADPLLYVGGLLGCVFIGIQAAVVRTIGVLVLGLAILSGQVVSAALLDLVLAIPGHELGPLTAVGAGLTLVAVVIAAIPPRKRPTGSSGSPSR
jgi:transporter family-2 protein